MKRLTLSLAILLGLAASASAVDPWGPEVQRLLRQRFQRQAIYQQRSYYHAMPYYGATPSFVYPTPFGGYPTFYGDPYNPWSYNGFYAPPWYGWGGGY